MVTFAHPLELKNSVTEFRLNGAESPLPVMRAAFSPDHADIAEAWLNVLKGRGIQENDMQILTPNTPGHDSYLLVASTAYDELAKHRDIVALPARTQSTRTVAPAAPRVAEDHKPASSPEAIAKAKADAQKGGWNYVKLG